MLRRLNVQTRLVAVIAVPLVLLLAIAVPEVLERRARAGDAGQAADAIAAVDDLAAGVEAIQGERTLEAARRAGAGATVEQDLADARDTTDAAVDLALTALTDLARQHPDLIDPARVAHVQLEGLAQVREDSGAAESIVPWEDHFAPLIEALLTVHDAAASVAADLGVGEGLTAVALVARAKEAAAAQGAQVAAASVWGGLRGDQIGILTDLRADEAAFRAAYLTGSPSTSREARRDELLATGPTTAARVVDGMIGGAPVGDLTGWLDTSDARQQALRVVEADRIAEADAEAERVATTSTRASRGYLALAGTGLLAALVLALAAARSITRPLRQLTDAADVLAADRLPKLVDTLRNPVADDEHYLTAAMEPIPVRSGDELGRLAKAFNAVQSVAVDVAAQQAALLKKGISDLYVNLARRNQSLLDRQIQHLDQLEREEQDVEVLEHLYLLDHLATRMRRNAESLLVLAGAESGPRRTQPAAVVDVVRAAVSEVEEYDRVDLGALADATLHGPAVSDIAHLVAELLENATHFSPPDSAVRVDGASTGGSYQLVITDEGVGMRPDQLEALNAVLRDPPVTGLALGRSLGCLVAARLAARHGIGVRLRAGAGQGVVASVFIPRHLLVEAAPATLATPPDAHASVRAPAPQPRAVEPASIDPRAAEPATLEEALPRADFDAGLQALLARDVPVLDGVGPAVGHAEDAPGARAVPMPEAPSPVPLKRRIPGASAEPLPEAPAAPAKRRDPAEVRAVLSRYRSGLEAGRGTDGPRDEERP
jgi:HAMP domain-containing protein